MKECIICREEKSDNEFNDEHVIQDSIQGYYHINSVCKNCNSKLGTAVDSTITNHKFSEFQRLLLNIKGKKGKIPNPFGGTHVLKDDPNQKIQLRVDKEGKLKPYILPSIPDLKSASFGDSFTVVVDKDDENKIDKIIDKIAKRNGIPRENIKLFRQEVKKEKPEIKIDLGIDISNFKMGLLKIAYEFCVDSIPEYYNDEKAILISEILKGVNFSKLENSDLFIGSGFENIIPHNISQIIDTKERNHYLILFSVKKYGLICFIKLFNMFSIVVKMSDKPDYLAEDMIIGINDFDKKEFVKLHANEFLAQLFTPIEYRFQYWIENSEIKEFMRNQQSDDHDYYRIGTNIPLFNKNGEIIYNDIDEKLAQPTLIHNDVGDFINEIITEIKMDEELYLKLLPNNKLYKVVSVRAEQYRK